MGWLADLFDRDHRDDDLLTGCDIGYIGDGMPDEHLPWVVLFATPLGIEDWETRREAVARLADEWRELFGDRR